MRTQTDTTRTTRKPSNDKALRAFSINIAEARELLARLQRDLDDHMGVDPESVHWGHAGDAAHVVESLREIAAFRRLPGGGK